MSSDVWFTNTAIDVAKAHSAAGNDTWMYYMTHTLPYSHYEGYDKGNVDMKPRFCQSDHMDDIPLTFGFPLTSTNFTREVSFTENDETLSEAWIKYIANFCKTGDPNKDGKREQLSKGVAEQWNTYNEEEGAFLKVRYPFEEKIFSNRKISSGTKPFRHFTAVAFTQGRCTKTYSRDEKYLSGTSELIT